MKPHTREPSALYTCPECRRLVRDFCERCGTTCGDRDVVDVEHTRDYHNPD